MKKAKLIVPAVNTAKALQNCIEHNTSVFCVENPLYSRLGEFVPMLSDYSIEDYPHKQIAIIKKNLLMRKRISPSIFLSTGRAGIPDDAKKEGFRPPLPFYVLTVRSNRSC